MKLRNLLPAASLAVNSFNLASALSATCRYKASPEVTALLDAIGHKATHELSYPFRNRELETATIKVQFHVYAPHNDTQPPIESEHLDSLLKVVQNSFQPHGFSFQRASKDLWHDKTALPFDEMMLLGALGAVHTGDFATLNIYLFPELPKDEGDEGFVAGLTNVKATLPVDGVSIIHDVIPNYSPSARFPESKEGKTLVHEIGHWLGLRHPFGLGCNLAQNTLGVPLQREIYEQQSDCYRIMDTCPDDKGNDPLNNYMNYMHDVCLTEFTTAQVKIMHEMMRHRRKMNKKATFAPPSLLDGM